MIVDFRLPHLGENITSADIVKINVAEGDKIEVDQIVVEIETDKATVEVPSDTAGVISKVYVKVGSKANVGDVILTIETEKAMSEKQEVESKKEEEIIVGDKKPEVKVEPKPITKQQQSTASIYEFKIPMLGENITSATITKILVKVGDNIQNDQIVLEIETDKATVEVPTEIGGVVKEVKVKEGDNVAVGTVAFVIETTSEIAMIKPSAESDEVQKKIDRFSPATNDNKSIWSQKIEHTHAPTVVTLPRDVVKVVVPAAPSVRRFAREIGVDIHQVRGSGTGGRISIDDVKAFAKVLNQQLSKGMTAVGAMKEPLPDFSKWGDVDRQPMSNIRRKTAEHLSYAWATIPHVTQFDKADITVLERLRKQFSKKVEEAGGKLTVTAILLKVIASALKEYPQFNSSVNVEKAEIVYKKYFNIGVAVDTDRGLLVPVIRDVDSKNISQISIELAEMSKRARDKKLSLDEMQGGCFTISNLGGIGGTYFAPIINSPEVAILGVSRSAYEPVYKDGKPAEQAGKFEPRLMMPLSLSYDHRIIDGADAIRFLRWVVNALENPFLLSLEG